PTRMAAAGAYVAALSSLSNGGQGLLLWKDGGLQTLALAGGLLSGRMVTNFNSLSVNSQGDVAALAFAQSEDCEQMLLLFTAASNWTPAPLDDTTRCSYSALPQRALDNQGGLAYRYGNSLYYRRPDGTVQTVLSIGDRPGGISPVANITNWGTTTSGKL